MDQDQLKKHLERYLTKRQLYLDKSRIALFKKAGTLENALLERLLTKLLEEIRVSDGRIISNKEESTLSNAIDRVFEQFFKMDMPKLMSQMAGNLNQILQLNASYYQPLYESDSKGKKFSAITKKVQNNLFKRLGVGEDLSITKDGYLDRMLKNDAGARDRVKKITYNSTINGMPLADFTKALKVEMTSIPNISEGWLMKYLRGFAYDVYTKFDRSINKEFAVRLDLKYFIYEGGLLETSRDFCIEKDGKVFTTEEAERDWPKDPLLLKTKAEKAAGVLLDYVPLEDMGRWRCNHLASYIGWQLAVQLRPDLVSTLTPEQKKLAGITDPQEKKPATEEKKKPAPKPKDPEPSTKIPKAKNAEKLLVFRSKLDEYISGIGSKIFDGNLDDALSNLKEPTNVSVIQDGNKGGAHYNSTTKTIRFNKATARYMYSKDGASFTVFHEIGHAVHHQNKIIYNTWKDPNKTPQKISDYQSNVDPEFLKAFEQAQKILEKLGPSKLEDDLFNIRNSAYQNYKELGYPDSESYQDDATVALDIIGSLTKGKYGGGHSVSYYNELGNRYAEVFAHGYAMQYQKSRVVSEFMKEIDKILDEYMKSKFDFKKRI